MNMDMDNINLNEFCGTGGCSSKLDPTLLHNILSHIPKKSDSDLLVGFDSSDDGAIYKLSEDICIINTLDFFTPLVEDPYVFGQIAAANALSDVYAMGGIPKVCMNIVASSSEDPKYLTALLKGGADKVLEADAVLCGGHSIKDTTTKYGLSVTGVVHPDDILRNNSCKVGDSIVLTKPLGTGIILSAALLNDCPKDILDECTTQMQTLNKYAFMISKNYKVNALTDVTGFGFLGHLNEMANSHYSILVHSKKVHTITDALKFAKEFYITGNGQKNRNHLKNDIVLEDLSFEMQELLYDPQTSGGLLISLPKEEAEKMVQEMQKNNVNAQIVAEVVDRREKNIYVER